MCLQGQNRLQLQLVLSCLCFLPCGWFASEQAWVAPIFQGRGREIKPMLVKSQSVQRLQLVPVRSDLAHDCWVSTVSSGGTMPAGPVLVLPWLWWGGVIMRMP